MGRLAQSPHSYDIHCYSGRPLAVDFHFPRQESSLNSSTSGIYAHKVNFNRFRFDLFGAACTLILAQHRGPDRTPDADREIVYQAVRWLPAEHNPVEHKRSPKVIWSHYFTKLATLESPRYTADCRHDARLKRHRRKLGLQNCELLQLLSLQKRTVVLCRASLFSW